MVNYINKENSKKIEKIISNIQNSEEYITCIKLKEKMNQDKELMSLINKVRNIQKMLVKNDYKEEYVKKLEQAQEKLKQNIIYQEYNYNLRIVNEKIYIVKSELNDYFQQKVDYLK